jgi:hypothetical protein
MRGFLLIYTFFVLCLLCVLCVVVCRVVGPGLWYSASFGGHGSLEQVELGERSRKNEALSWGAHVKLSFQRQMKHGWFVCLVISSGGRKGAEDQTSLYAAHALHSLFAGMSDEEMQHVYAIAIVGNGANPLPNLLKQFHEVVEEPPSNGKAAFAKVKHAHATALEMCRSKSNLTLWIEDDVSASRNIVNKVKQIVPQAVEFARKQKKDWMLVKLFYTDFWSGWSTETTPKFVAVSVSAVLIGFVVLAVVLRLQRRPADVIVMSFMFAMTILFCLFWTSFNLGRQNVFPDFADGVNPYKGALAQALLYNNLNVAEIENLKSRLRNDAGKFFRFFIFLFRVLQMDGTTIWLLTIG